MIHQAGFFFLRYLKIVYDDIFSEIRTIARDKRLLTREIRNLCGVESSQKEVNDEGAACLNRSGSFLEAQFQNQV